ncbi:MAG: phage integrase SAM-like domain-containing protein [Rhizobiales bacterium]|nr:phage integrase SAM-like domain-containing protein [Hyphomicrobiales bacterium]NRB14959.1 phage integrase SAM-like domain-containing protein [Hyphomicrobiales bacterium]
MSLKTKDPAIAMIRRDVIARADDEYWNDPLGGIDRNSTEANYDRVISRARHMNIRYRSQTGMLPSFTPDELLKRLEMLEGNVGKSKIATGAVLGAATAPSHKCSDILDIYVKDIVATQIRNKNNAQRQRWIVSHRRILNNFMAVCGDVVFTEINRENTPKYYDYLKNKVLSNNTGNGLSAGRQTAKLVPFRLFSNATTSISPLSS